MLATYHVVWDGQRGLGRKGCLLLSCGTTAQNQLHSHSHFTRACRLSVQLHLTSCVLVGSNTCAWISTAVCEKIERIIVLLSASPEGEARLPMPKGMAYKE
jgi:hypothetical protein